MCHAAFMFSGVSTSIRVCGCRGQRRRDAELLARQRRQSSCGVARKMLGPHVALPPSDARRREKRSPRTGVNDISPRLPSVRWSAETSHETIGLQRSPHPQHRGKACGERPLFRSRCRGGEGLLCPRPRRREGSAPHSPQSAIVMDGRVLCRNEW